MTLPSLTCHPPLQGESRQCPGLPPAPTVCPLALLPTPPWCPCRMKKEDDSLTIFGVAERDQGSYTCVASTELDQDLAKAYLTVLGNCHRSHAL